MSSHDPSPRIAVLLVIIALCTLFTGCTSVQNTGQPAVATMVPTPTGTAAVVTAVITTAPVEQALPTELIRKPPSDTEFLIAYDASQAKILDLITVINAELAKDSVLGNTSTDYTALGSYARNLGSSIDGEITAMNQFREISDPANESRKEYYVNYLTQLKPFAADLETGASLAQKKEFNTASGFLLNAKNDLTIVSSQELPAHLKIISQIRENFGPFTDSIQQQGTYPALT